MATKTAEKYTPRLKTHYDTTVLQKYVGSGKYKNRMQVPKLDKITLSCSLKDALLNPKALEALAQDMTNIAGQKVSLRKSKKAISNFKLRAGINLGCMVTLRRDRMYDFLDRFVSLACPRIRDFKGFPEKSFDGRGNYSFGIKEHIIFPEVNYDQIDKIRGFNITINTTAQSDSEALDLLREMGFPFRRQGA
ncbi:MAG: 50S ribosomal protein L5 [Proteobacteria bacterium]|nr:50S ribosomal protein L5 [Pseudomonadota bacterium]